MILLIKKNLITLNFNQNQLVKNYLSLRADDVTFTLSNVSIKGKKVIPMITIEIIQKLCNDFCADDSKSFHHQDFQKRQK